MAPTDNPLKKLAQGAGFSFIGLVISTGFKYFTQVVLAWFLGTEDFGLFTLGIVIYQLGELFSRMGLELGAVRYVSIHNNSGNRQKLKGVLQQSIGLPFLVGSLFGTLIFIGADFIAQGIFKQSNLADVLRIIGISLPFGAAMTSGAFATTGFQTTKYRTYLLEILQPATNLGLSLLLCIIGWGLWGASLAWLLSFVLTLAATIYFIHHLFPDWLNQKVKAVFETRQLLSFSLPLSFGTFLWLVLIWTDILFLGYFRSPEEVGIYRAASQTALLMILFTRSLITIFSPMIADLYERGELGEVSMLFRTASRWSFSLTLPLLLIVSVTSKDILSIFGSEFQVGWLCLIILSAGQVARSGPGGLAMHMLAMSGHQNLKLVGDFVLAIANIGLNMLLIPSYGFLGAAIATGISIIGVNLLQVGQVYRVLGIKAYDFNYLKTILAGCIALVFGFAVRTWLSPINFLLATAITSLVITAVYGLLLVAIGLEKSDQVLLNKVRSRFALLKSDKS